MEYTIQNLANLAGISTRTLRYYDEIQILKPARVNSSGYRIYGVNEIDKLQQIMFYRELGLNLDRIKEIVGAPTFDKSSALKEHHEQLLAKRNQLNILITNVEKTILLSEGKINMRNQEKFKGFKKQIIEENDNKYGIEIRDKYGSDTIEESNAKIMNMTEEQYTEFKLLETSIIDKLKVAFVTGDPTSETAMELAEMHKRWLNYTWPHYSKEAHAGLADMYIEDERFLEYYEKEQPGGAKFLRDCIYNYTGTPL